MPSAVCQESYIGSPHKRGGYNIALALFKIKLFGEEVAGNYKIYNRKRRRHNNQKSKK